MSDQDKEQTPPPPPPSQETAAVSSSPANTYGKGTEGGYTVTHEAKD